MRAKLTSVVTFLCGITLSAALIPLQSKTAVSFSRSGSRPNKVDVHANRHKMLAQRSKVRPEKAFEGESFERSTSSLSMSASASNESKEVDIEAVGKYFLSAGIEISLLAVFLRLVDAGMSPERGMSELPLPVITAFFYGLSLKSRVFNPLNNQRPNLGKDDKPSKGFGDRVMPSWTPPGVFFPILWVFINAPLRAYSTTLIYEANGHVLCDPVILCLMWHLTCGDVWNTINNTEKRLGASVAGVATVWLSVWYAIYRYYEVDPFAGKLLGLTGVWITIAAALVTDTWRLNPVADGNLDVLYPVKSVGEDSKTKFFFEEE